MKRFLAAFFLLATLIGFPGHQAGAQATDSVTVAATGLINPAGFAIGGDGHIYVAESGTGGDTPSASQPMYSAGSTGRVSRVDGGCPTTIDDHLPSARSSTGETLGPDGLTIVGGSRSFILSGAGGAAHGNPESPAAVLEITGGDTTLVADLGAWLAANPPAYPPTTADADGIWSGMTVTPDGMALVAVERNGGQVVRISLADGTITRVADLSTNFAEPTDVAFGPDGMLYVSTFSASPYKSGTANVIKLAGDGSEETVWSGLTMVTAIAFGPDGTLYATEYSDSRDDPPFFIPGTGRVVRQSGADTQTDVLTNLNFPGDMAFGPDGALLVSLPTVGADDGSGQILRVIPGDESINVSTQTLAAPSCGQVNTVVKVSDYGFDPPVLTVPAGTTVTWNNVGELNHIVASAEGSAVQWNSGDLGGGDTFSFTFTTTGTYPYLDKAYPDRTAEIVVT